MTDSLAQTVRRYRREIASALIAVKWHLDTPYPDSPEWTPWTRFVERALRKVDEIPALVDDLVGQLDQAEREALDWQAACEESQASEADLLDQRDEWAESREYWKERAEKAEREREPREQLIGKLAGKLREAERENAALREALGRAAVYAENLMEMIDPQTWRDTGGDDGQGHYEGDYRAARVMEDIAGWKALASFEPAPEGDTALDELVGQFEEVKQRLDQAERALRRYGSHDDQCARYQYDFRNSEPTCLCGYEAALASSGPTPEGSDG